MTDRCEEVDEKIDSFIKEIYLPNNKEFTRLSEAVEDLSKEFREHIVRTEEYKRSRELEEAQFRAEMRPVLDFFQGITFTKKLFLGIVGILATIIGLVLGIKKLLE